MSHRVAYYYDPEVPNKHYGPGHPMKPQRLRLTHELVLSYGLHRSMDVLQSRPASGSEMQIYHDPSYVDFLRRIAPRHTGTASNDEKGSTSKANATIDEYASRYNCGEQTDCPIFEGLYEFCQHTSGASIDGAARLNAGLSDICVNWSGGLHHAKKSEASGFCFINDIVLAILELLRVHQRVLYIDIDIHHGDGVEEAFYFTNRVMTCSFHRYGDFFPGTGDLNDVGGGEGRGYSVNFPLKDGLDDESFAFCFKPVLTKIFETYDPGAVVLQCGADSLAGDRLGVWDLSLRGHAACVEFVKSFGKPTLVLGGGGYTINNVARCWAYETSVCVGARVPDAIPARDAFYEYYSPSYTLHGLSLDRSSNPGSAAFKLSQAAAAAVAGGEHLEPSSMSLWTAASRRSISAPSGGSALNPGHPTASGSSGSAKISALTTPSSTANNPNTIPYMTQCRDTILARLDALRGPPSVGIQSVPPSWTELVANKFNYDSRGYMDDEETDYAGGNAEVDG